MQTIKELGSYTFQAVLDNSVRQFKDRPAVAFVFQKPLLYRDVQEKIISLRNYLYKLGINAGDAVALYSHSSPQWGIAYFAIVTMGAIAVPLLPDFNKKEVAACVAHAAAAHIIVSQRLYENVPEDMQTVIDIADFSLKKGELIRTEDAPPHTCAEDDTASVIYTSGTTGRSKGVELSHKNLVWNAVAGQHFQRINEYDCALSILPLSHAYEFTIGFLMFFLNGACVYYLEGMPTPRVLIPALQKVRPTLMVSVPMVIEKIYKNKILPTFTETPFLAKLYSTKIGKKILDRLAGKKLRKTFGGRIKFFGLGGSKTDSIVEEFMKNAKFPYAIGYGLTETAPLVLGTGVRHTKPGWLGYALPGVEIKVADPHPETGIGELLVKGPNVMKNYYRDPALTKAAFTDDGWFKTGDLFMMDKRGCCAIKGRSKNMILRASGENIYPEDIEFVLNQHPFVSESLVAEGEKSSLVAYVQLDEEKISAEIQKDREKQRTSAGFTAASLQNWQTMVADVAELIAYKRVEILNEIKFFVNENVNKISHIDKIEMVSNFEKTASQKIKRYLYSFANRKKKDTEGSLTDGASSLR